ncbi:MAG TPA: class I SAM-dependent methyltransferase [Tabrizicola sp.]|nr:class I SAM-dependent methyltransferase [Tabrizicola sp.]
MVDTARHTAWSSAESYELCIGRWGRQIAQRFLDRLGPAPGLDWVEVGCGTGALSQAILRNADPARLTAVEPSTAFLAIARETVVDPRARFLAGAAPARRQC